MIIVTGCADATETQTHNGHPTGIGTNSPIAIDVAPLAPTPKPTPTPQQPSFTDEIHLAVDHLYRLRIACGRSPHTCNVAALSAPSGTYRSALADLMAFRVRYGLRTIAGHGSFRHRVDSVARIADDRAVVHTCTTDSLVVFDTVSADTGIVFDDSVVSTRTEWTLVRHEGKWKWSEGRILEQRRGDGLCDGF
jgi:hypothetical protein